MHADELVYAGLKDRSPKKNVFKLATVLFAMCNLHHARFGQLVRPARAPCNTKGYSSTYLAIGFANVRVGTWYPPEH